MMKLAIRMIAKKNIDYAIIVNGKKYVAYKRKPYKPVSRFYSSSEAIQYARENRYILIVSITDKKPNRWLVMKEVKDGTK